MKRQVKVALFVLGALLVVIIWLATSPRRHSGTARRGVPPEQARQMARTVAQGISCATSISIVDYGSAAQGAHFKLAKDQPRFGATLAAVTRLLDTADPTNTRMPTGLGPTYDVELRVSATQWYNLRLNVPGAFFGIYGPLMRKRYPDSPTFVGLEYHKCPKWFVEEMSRLLTAGKD